MLPPLTAAPNAVLLSCATAASSKTTPCISSRGCGVCARRTNAIMAPREYMQVSPQPDGSLLLTREPSRRSWMVFIVASLASIFAWMVPTLPLNRLSLSMAALYVAIEFMESWQSCRVYPKGRVTITSTSILQKLTMSPAYEQVFELDVIRVFVDAAAIRYFGTSYRVVLELEDGRELGVSDCMTTGDPRSHEEVARKIGEVVGVEPELLPKEPPLPKGFAGFLEWILRDKFRGVRREHGHDE
eukprot:m.70379 g.70379  ORF g.70379 m.70379 type:complete len:243 (-) comp7876_c0_seq1:1230-1958(-)